jgi:ATP-dependent DNA helicase RecG
LISRKKYNCEKYELEVKVSINGDKLTENKIAILTYMIEDPYISKSDLSKFVGISTAAISNNIEAMRGKYLRRVGPDKGGFWEIIE